MLWQNSEAMGARLEGGEDECRDTKDDGEARADSPSSLLRRVPPSNGAKGDRAADQACLQFRAVDADWKAIIVNLGELRTAMKGIEANARSSTEPAIKAAARTFLADLTEGLGGAVRGPGVGEQAERELLHLSGM